MISIFSLNSYSFSKDDKANTNILILKKIQLPISYMFHNPKQATNATIKWD